MKKMVLGCYCRLVLSAVVLAAAVVVGIAIMTVKRTPESSR